MKSDIWMPLYVGDYMGDTIGLTNAEHGAYLLSMMKYWRQGESLTQKELKDICKADFDRVSKFYTLDEGRWHHKRIDFELQKAYDRIQSFRAKSLKMVAARREKGQI